MFNRVLAAANFTLEAGSHIEMMTPYDFATTNNFDFQGNALVRTETKLAQCRLVLAPDALGREDACSSAAC